MHFTATLRAWLAAHGHSTPLTAALIGISSTTLHDWLTGGKIPHPLTIAAVEARLRGELPFTEATPQGFARALKLWRAQTGISQPVAAAALGTKREALSMWERGHQPCPLITDKIMRRLQSPAPTVPEKVRPICPEKIARALRAWRRRNRLTQTEAARVLGCTSIGKWETLEQYPPDPAGLLARLAATRARGSHLWLTRPTQRIAFGKKLRVWRKAQRIKQARLCELLGLAHDPARISNIERGRSLPRPALRTRILALIAQ